MREQSKPTQDPDRRFTARYESVGITASVRARGHFLRQPADVLDFNRHGAAVLTSSPLGKDHLVYLQLESPRFKTLEIVAVVHNCIPQSGGYRAGVRFRTESRLQNDAEKVEAQLRVMEAQMSRTSGIAHNPV